MSPEAPDQDLGVSPIEAEIASEKAASLGRAGRLVETCLAALRDPGSSVDPAARLQAAVEAVYAYFVQREQIGLRDHRSAIADFDIPRAVLARLGAQPRP